MGSDHVEQRPTRLRRRRAEGIKTEPNWPLDLSLGDLLRLGFADKIIDSPEHPYVMRLRGLAE